MICLLNSTTSSSDKFVNPFPTTNPSRTTTRTNKVTVTSNFKAEVKNLLQRIENSICEIEQSDVKIVPVSHTESYLNVLKDVQNWLNQVKEVRAFGEPPKFASHNVIMADTHSPKKVIQDASTIRHENVELSVEIAKSCTVKADSEPQSTSEVTVASPTTTDCPIILELKPATTPTTMKIFVVTTEKPTTEVKLTSNNTKHFFDIVCRPTNTSVVATAKRSGEVELTSSTATKCLVDVVWEPTKTSVVTTQEPTTEVDLTASADSKCFVDIVWEPTNTSVLATEEPSTKIELTSSVGINCLVDIVWEPAPTTSSTTTTSSAQPPTEATLTSSSTAKYASHTTSKLQLTNATTQTVVLITTNSSAYASVPPSSKVTLTSSNTAKYPSHTTSKPQPTIATTQTAVSTTTNAPACASVPPSSEPTLVSTTTTKAKMERKPTTTKKPKTVIFSSKTKKLSVNSAKGYPATTIPTFPSRTAQLSVLNSLSKGGTQNLSQTQNATMFNKTKVLDEEAALTGVKIMLNEASCVRTTEPFTSTTEATTKMCDEFSSTTSDECNATKCEESLHLKPLSKQFTTESTLIPGDKLSTTTASVEYNATKCEEYAHLKAFPKPFTTESPLMPGDNVSATTVEFNETKWEECLLERAFPKQFTTEGTTEGTLKVCDEFPSTTTSDEYSATLREESVLEKALSKLKKNFFSTGTSVLEGLEKPPSRLSIECAERVKSLRLNDRLQFQNKNATSKTLINILSNIYKRHHSQPVSGNKLLPMSTTKNYRSYFNKDKNIGQKQTSTVTTRTIHSDNCTSVGSDLGGRKTFYQVLTTCQPILHNHTSATSKKCNASFSRNTLFDLKVASITSTVKTTPSTWSAFKQPYFKSTATIPFSPTSTMVSRKGSKSTIAPRVDSRRDPLVISNLPAQIVIKLVDVDQPVACHPSGDRVGPAGAATYTTSQAVDQLSIKLLIQKLKSSNGINPRLKYESNDQKRNTELRLCDKASSTVPSKFIRNGTRLPGIQSNCSLEKVEDKRLPGMKSNGSLEKVEDKRIRLCSIDKLVEDLKYKVYDNCGKSLLDIYACPAYIFAPLAIVLGKNSKNISSVIKHDKRISKRSASYNNNCSWVKSANEITFQGVAANKNGISL